MSNVAKEIIKPTTPGIFRAIFLYTGQGESTLLVIPEGNNYKYVLIDSDLDKEPYEVDIVRMLDDLFDEGEELNAFINTHPHKDHLGGVKEIYDTIGIKEVWHSNHKPAGKRNESSYEELKYVLQKVGTSNEYLLKGSNDKNKLRKKDDSEISKKLGDIDFIVLSPAEYLCEDIEGEDADAKNRRIHEQCGVIKFSYGKTEKHLMVTGDSDKTAWKDHITDYHYDKLPSETLSASHHGSRSFFKSGEDDEDVYEKHIQKIKPQYVIISAPRQDESPHGHPHDDAMELYKKYVAEENILHLGKNRECVIMDIDQNGNLEVRLDKKLVEEYGLKPDDNNKNESNKAVSIPFIGSQTSRIDKKPFG